MAEIKICPVCGAPVTVHERMSGTEMMYWLEAQSKCWIPVEERLPETNGEYLVCYGVLGIKHNLIQVCPYECGFGFWRMTPYSEGFDQVVVEGVTHWMPLPKPPEEV